MGNHCCNKMSSSRNSSNSKLDSKLDSMKFETPQTSADLAAALSAQADRWSPTHTHITHLCAGYVAVTTSTQVSAA